jgi:hypothetical protein
VLLRDLPQPATATAPQAPTSPTDTGYQGPTDTGQGGANQHRPGDGAGRSTHHDATGPGPDPRPDGSTDRRRTGVPAVAGLDVTV